MEQERLGIFTAISKVMEEIGAIGKEKKNVQQGFMYRGIDDVMNALQPALVKNNVFVVPYVVEQTREDRQTKNGGNLIYSICKVLFRFYTTDGSFVEALTIGEGMDSGDKATNKAMAIAFKYACFQVFCIPTEEMKDPDAEVHEPVAKGKETKTEEKQENSNELKQTIAEIAKVATELLNGGADKTKVSGAIKPLNNNSANYNQIKDVEVAKKVLEALNKVKGEK